MRGDFGVHFVCLGAVSQRTRILWRTITYGIDIKQRAPSQTLESYGEQSVSYVIN